MTIGNIITLGIGTPSDITHFVLVGLGTAPTKGGATASSSVVHAATGSDAIRGAAAGSEAAAGSAAGSDS